MSLPPSPPHRICLNREGKRPRFGQVSIEEHLNPKKVSWLFPVPQFVSRELCSLNLLLSRAHHQFSIISELSHPEHSLFWHLSLRSAIYLLTIPTPQSIHHRSRVPAPSSSTEQHFLAFASSIELFLFCTSAPGRAAEPTSAELGWMERGRASRGEGVLLSAAQHIWAIQDQNFWSEGRKWGEWICPL